VGTRGKIAAGILLAAMLALAAGAGAARKIERVEIVAGDLKIVGHGGFRPETLPRYHDAPIELYGGGKLSTLSGDYPPILKTITFEFDKHGSVDNTGLPVCTAAKLQATTVPAARRACPGSIVGQGVGHAIVVFPEQAPISISSPITLFNGPKVRGFDSVLAHAYTNVPVATTFIVPVVIEKIHKGVYGYRTEATIPPIAGGAGIPIAGSITVGRKWTYKGKKHSYINARCETGHLQARGEFGFKDGTLLTGTFFRPCKVAK
jgi:hypothetical protein